MVVTMYAGAITNAIRRGDLQEMKAVLRNAKSLRREQGNLDAAITRLQKAVKKLGAKKPARKSAKKSGTRTSRRK